MSTPDHPRRPPRWRPLTREVTDPTSPVREFFEDTFPRVHRRALQHRYRTSAGPLLIPPAPGVNGGTLGSAFDIWVQLQRTPHPPMDLALLGSAFTPPRVQRSLRHLLDRLGLQDNAPDRVATGPWVGADLTGDDLLRTAWVLALFVELYRAGPAPGSPLTTVRTRRWRRRTNLLTLPSSEVVESLRRITTLAEEHLLGPLRANPVRTVLGPTFALSTVMPADADMVHDGTLLELKTNLGQAKPDGTRECTLTLPTLLQVLGYLLHDADDDHHIDTISLYQARYAHLATWPVDDLLAELAGHPVHLGDLRTEWTTLLDNGPPPSW